MTIDIATGVILVLVALLVIVFGVGIFRKRPRKLKTEHFQKEWQEVQRLCKDKTTWPLVIINADKLLDTALRKRRVKGKTMGERLVSAQRTFTDNDSLWYAHKLRNRLVQEEPTKLKETDVKRALVGIRQALRDLGALK